MLNISRNVSIPDNEIEISAVRAQGPGGQNVNKVASAIHLRFDIRASNLPAFYKDRLLACSDRRITREGVIIIKAQRYRSQDKNREDALGRLQAIVRNVASTPKKRTPTRPTRSSRKKRLDQKIRRGRDKTLRGKVTGEE